ncbi:hypothetical protein SAMN04488503_3013 [Humidesulfovibrio mexicanus]|uniref:Uncharacterized protein n=1 Tax=Humidesulfovibrio mexicanus TaxID=147047 RepID=A0A239C8F7_9BACT|nr:hypothetical protein [Humidesulfovibrio mexicanus]SNS16517.1 hypothetical protein SAMN04488503_3013 [Humidesulfovibrio mexicanus]
MRPFEAMLARHAQTVFLNPRTFAGPLSIDGRPVTAMWDASMQPGGAGEAMYGVNVERRLLLALAAELPTRPVSGQELVVDDVYWTVGPVRDCEGILEIELSRNLS